MNRKQRVRINKNQLRQIVMESVKRVLKENKIIQEGKKTNNINFQKQYHSGDIDFNELKRLNDKYDMFSSEVRDKQTQRGKNKSGDPLAWKEKEVKTHGYADSDGNIKTGTYIDFLKWDILRYAQDYYGCEVYNWEDFKTIPVEKRREIIDSYIEDNDSGRIAKDRECRPTGSWINGEWWDGYVN